MGDRLYKNTVYRKDADHALRGGQDGHSGWWHWISIPRKQFSIRSSKRIEDSSNACGLSDGVNNNIVGQDPVLGPLQDNGGPSFTHALLAGSPTLDAGNTMETSDQRGVKRPQGGADDIGAYELFDCTSQPWQASNSGQLDAAIACFNVETSGSHTINITQDIDLTNGSTVINNSGAGVSLVIEGNGFMVNGQGIEEVRPFHTENSYKYTTEQFLSLASHNGFANVRHWQDDEGLFAIYLLQV